MLWATVGIIFIITINNIIIIIIIIIVIGVIYITTWLEFLRRSRSSRKKVDKDTNKPADANEKPSLPKEVLAKADIDVLSHKELLDTVNSHINNNSNNNSNTNNKVSASTNLSTPAKAGDIKLEIANTRYSFY